MMNYSYIRSCLEQAVQDERSLSCTDSYSRYVYRGFAFLRALGLTVEEHSKDLPENVVGRISYKYKTVKFDESSASHALMTIAHETGHWISYLRYSYRENSTNRERERWAYFYGWVVLKWLGARSLISKESWRNHHFLQNLEEPGELGWQH